jgi:ribosomal protein S6--L-glutamate ligase
MSVDLAGFDLVFPEEAPPSGLLFLEINWYFGRRGLGGADAYYRILLEEINAWLRGLGLRPEKGVPPS